MTLGRKLSNCRKLAGLTQQQLGEKMNVSAQAISKWEKDMAEPDLASLRALAELYKVTVDDLLDPNVDLHTTPKHENTNEEQTQNTKESSGTIGFCKMCGLVVRAENMGSREPVLVCKSCLERKRTEQAQEQEKAKKAMEEAARKEKYRKMYISEALKKRLIWSLTIGSIVLILLLAIGIPAGISVGGGSVVFSIIFALMLGCFFGALFFDCAVREVILDWTSKSFHAPGLIFTFDLDGFAWLIGMKILFWIIGLLFGIVVGIIGITLAVIISPFVYPFVITKVVKCMKLGIESEYVELR